MVQFIDIDGTQPVQGLPSVAMNFNNRFIENIIDGYRTLNVSGREVISYDIHTMGDSTSIHGEIVSGKTLPARELTVEYQLSADTNESFQEKFRELLELLHTDGDTVVYFNDDDDIVYNGQLSTMGDVPPNSNSITSTFTVYCQDPMKYTRNGWSSIEGTSTTLNGSDLSLFDITPDMIKIRPMVTLTPLDTIITVTNIRSGRKIVFYFGGFVGTISSTQYIGIDIKNNNIRIRNVSNNNIVSGTGNLVKYLDYNVSDFHEFKVKRGDTLTVSNPNLRISVDTRGEWR